MPRILLVPDLPLDHSPVMDKYGHRLHDWLESSEPSLEVRLAAHIGELTRETRDGRSSGGFIRWWTQPVDPARVRSEEHTSELQSPCNLVCRLLLEKKQNKRGHSDASS